MISSYEKIDTLFREIDEALRAKVNAYIIGGAAMLYKGRKPATKDIDIVVSLEKEFENFRRALTNSGFVPKKKTPEYGNMNIDNIFIRDDFRIDLFLSTICSKLVFSENMKRRSEIAKNHGKLSIFIASDEDILLLKSVTGERAGDLEDCIALAKSAPYWDTIRDEINNQISFSGKDVWITYIEERFNEMEKENVNIPIMRNIRKDSHKYYNKYNEM